jgi:large subunit ribosomal protein L5
MVFMMAEENNPMRAVKVDKVTLNIGVGGAGEELENAKTLLGRLTGKKAVQTLARVRNPVFKIKKGDPIGAKVTLRGNDALAFLKRALHVKENRLSERNFDREGNFSFGVPEYIELPDAKYDPKIGIIGFDVCVTLKRKGGWRCARRRRGGGQIGAGHRLNREECVEFARSTLGVEVS